ncbi:hypothetical protein DIURU_005153 [Diutina rugosa]|uniref:Cytochrome P450 n=1 Tax=Diutina rugosa TaxID=5481 RepID=A0A642UEG7_DIURU|nr:uncharacterized protein DIURU_005153 [Diutina rugosa]KAA8897554.1 hypothetical protein DIURU_005153 [Diutina rugosa]
MNVLAVLATLIVAYVVITRLNMARRRRRFPQAADPRAYANDHALGFQNMFKVTQAIKEGRLPRHALARYQKYGSSTIKLPVAGSDIIVTRDPENIKAILSTQFPQFSLGLRHAQFFPLLGDGIFTLDGNGWKHSRTMLRPQFAREQVAHVRSLEPHVQMLARHIDLADGGEIDIQELFFKLTLDAATEFLFGQTVGSLQEAKIGATPPLDVPGRDRFADSFGYSQRVLAKRAGLNKLFWLCKPSEFTESSRQIHQFTDFYVNSVLKLSPEELEKNSSGNYTFLYELAKHTRDPQVLRDQALNILLAGRDTTAGLLSFLFHELARYPKVFAKLRDEVVSVFGEGEDAHVDDITFESLKQCEYLKAVINETLRLYPSVPSNSRRVEEDTTLPRGGGVNGDKPVFVPKGSSVSYQVYSMHRDPKYYGEDAEEFRPERWFEPETRKLGWAYLPFNGGPRICLGQQFALTEASYVTVRLLQMFRHIDDYNDGRVRLDTHLTMSLLDGCNIGLRR